MKEVNYTVINHVAREKLGLTWFEYGLADLIYNLSNNPKGDYPGWCYASKPTISKILGVSEREVYRMIEKLIKLNLVEKHPVTKHLKVTPDWYELVIIKTPDQMAVPLTTSHDTPDQMAGHTPDQMADNKDIYNKDNNKTNTIVLQKAGYGDPGINEVSQYFLAAMGIPKEDCSQRQSRQYWKLLLNESKTGVSGVKWLIDQLVLDTFYKHNITSSKDLYYNRIKIVARRRGETSGKVAIQT